MTRKLLSVYSMNSLAARIFVAILLVGVALWVSLYRRYPRGARIFLAILLVGLVLFCGFGFLAAYELGFPNIFHAIYGAAGAAALLGAIWLVVPSSGRSSIATGTSGRQRTS